MKVQSHSTIHYVSLLFQFGVSGFAYLIPKKPIKLWGNRIRVLFLKPNKKFNNHGLKLVNAQLY
jgi:hypothetical protein